MGRAACLVIDRWGEVQVGGWRGGEAGTTRLALDWLLHVGFVQVMV